MVVTLYTHLLVQALSWLNKYPNNRGIQMANITNREDFKDYCLRRLGFPVIELNLDEDQIQDRIDDALQYWQDYQIGRASCRERV